MAAMRSLKEIQKRIEGPPCSCGRVHAPVDCEILIGSGILSELPALLGRLKIQKPFVLADINTFAAAGEEVCKLLSASEIPHASYVFRETSLEPGEAAVGSAVMHFDSSCDGIIGVGSGVINDIGKLLSSLTGRKYVIVATAPSMDGYASASSSMTRDGLKISLPTRCADAVMGDVEILRAAPLRMLRAGIGDMLAKYISIGEWRIAHIITGEYYCERVAELIRAALKKCVEHAEGLLRREAAAVAAVFEGLVLAGLAMAYAGVSRPASGVEHYFSHVWDMRGVAFGTPVELHGLQCGVGTLYAARIYDRLRTLTPDRERALSCVESFDLAAYQQALRDFVGEGAESMIAAEKTDGKYDVIKHQKRLEVILGAWEEIRSVIEDEIPPAEEIDALLRLLGAPRSCSAFGIPEEELPRVFAATKDIRDKYVASRLAFDLGVIEEITF